MIGELNQGWYVFTAGRNFARAHIGIPASGKRNLEDFIEYCKETRVNGEILGKKAMVRQKLAEYAIAYEASLKLAYYVGWLQSVGQEVAAILLWGTEAMVSTLVMPGL